MYKMLWLCCFVSLAACTSTRRSIASIDQLLSRQEAAWNRGDLDQFMIGYLETDSLSMSGSGGITFGYETILDRYQKGYSTSEKMGQLKFTILNKRKLQSKTFLYLGRFDLQRADGNDDFGYFTLVFRKIQGEWTIVHDHTSAGRSK